MHSTNLVEMMEFHSFLVLGKTTVDKFSHHIRIFPIANAIAMKPNLALWSLSDFLVHFLGRCYPISLKCSKWNWTALIHPWHSFIVKKWKIVKRTPFSVAVAPSLDPTVISWFPIPNFLYLCPVRHLFSRSLPQCFLRGNLFQLRYLFEIGLDRGLTSEATVTRPRKPNSLSSLEASYTWVWTLNCDNQTTPYNTNYTTKEGRPT